MYALYAWLARVILQARDKKDSLGKYDPNLINVYSFNNRYSLRKRDL